MNGFRVREGVAFHERVLARPTFFWTEPAGRLMFEPGALAVRYRLRIAEGPRGPFEGDQLECVHRVADRDGAVWEARCGIGFPFDLYDHAAADPKFRACWWREMSPRARKRFRERLLLKGARRFDDRGLYSAPRVGSARPLIRHGRLSHGIDIAAGEASGEYLVRVRGLLDSGDSLLADFVFASRRDVLFRNAAPAPPGGPALAEEGLPLPVSFERTSLRAEPQPNVRSQPWSGEEAREACAVQEVPASSAALKSAPRWGRFFGR